MSEQQREALLRRKKRIGRKASYRKLADRVGRSSKTVWEVLNGEKLPFDIDVEGILARIEQALDEIEADENGEREAQSAPA